MTDRSSSRMKRAFRLRRTAPGPGSKQAVPIGVGSGDVIETGASHANRKSAFGRRIGSAVAIVFAVHRLMCASGQVGSLSSLP